MSNWMFKHRRLYLYIPQTKVIIKCTPTSLVSHYHSGFVSLWRKEYFLHSISFTPSILESSFRLLLPSAYSQFMVSYSWPFCLMNIICELPGMGRMCYVLLNIVTQKWKKEPEHEDPWQEQCSRRAWVLKQSKECSNKNRLCLWLRE